MSYHTRGVRQPVWKPAARRRRDLKSRPDPGLDHWKNLDRRKKKDSSGR